MKNIYFVALLLLFGNLELHSAELQNSDIDSTSFSKFNIHVGEGIIAGMRYGINYRISKSISFDLEKGINPLLLAEEINGAVNYHFGVNKGFVLNSSYSYMAMGFIDRAEHLYLVTPNIGYVYNNPERALLSPMICLKVGYGVGYFKSQLRSQIVYIPNIDISIGIQFQKIKKTKKIHY